MQVFEVEAMKRVRAMLPAQSLVTVPEIHLFDQEANVIVMDDCEQSGTLKALMQQAKISPVEAKKIGVGLGDFIGRLHSWSKGDPSVTEYFGQHQDGQRITSWVVYGRLISTLTGKDDVPKLKDPQLEVADADLKIIAQLAEERQKALIRAKDIVSVMEDK
jgi:5-methylthioribose kinase